MNTKKAIGGSLGAILVLIVSQLLAQIVGSLFVLIHLPVGVCNIIAGLLYVLFTYLLLKLLAEKVLKLDLKDLGIPHFSVKPKWIAVAVLLPAAVTAVFLLMPGTFVRTEMDDAQAFTILSAGIVFAGIGAGCVEEMVFRGFILNLLNVRWNRAVAVILPSILFGAIHIIGMDFSPLSCFLVLAAGTAVGIMFSLIELEGHSVWNSAVVHALWNIIIIGGGLTISGTASEYSLLNYVLDSQSFLLTGGEFGIESSIVAVIGYAIVIAATLLMEKKSRKN